MVHPEESARAFGDRYRLLQFVGEGSSARVFVAEDRTLHRRVALKIVRVEMADAGSFREHFADEMRVTSALNHPRVLPVHDWGLDPQPFTVTEYLAGGSLAALLGAGHRLTPSQALMVGLEAARALVNIHAAGRAHLGLVPTSILFDSSARPYISDLGLAAAVAAATRQPPGGSDEQGAAPLSYSPDEQGAAPLSYSPDEQGAAPLSYSPDEQGAAPLSYSPDEQGAAPLSYSPDEQAQDVYDLALVLCEAVTGVSVLASEDGDAALGSLTELGPMQAVLERVIAADPAERPSAAALAEELLRVAALLPRPDPIPLALSDGTPPASAAAPLERTEDLVQVGPSVSERMAVPLDDAPRRRWPGIALAAVLVLGGAVAGIWALFVSGSDTSPVPDLEGQTRAAAVAAASDLSWEVNEILVREPGTSLGRVVRTEPPAGAPLGEGATLDVFVSLGEPLIPVSDLGFLYGMTVDDATDELEALGLAPGDETLVNDAVVPSGLVVGLDVEEGVYEVEAGDEVDLLVSDGPSEAG